jgi:hypothetical protein
MAIEEHGAGRQLVRFRSCPRYAPSVLGLLALLVACAVGAAISRADSTFAFLVAAATILAARAVQQSGAAMAALDRAFREVGATAQQVPYARAPKIVAELRTRAAAAQVPLERAP